MLVTMNTLDVDLLNVGKNVIDIEANALQALKNNLGHSFIEAVHLVANSTGRLIISGMGKSGHIGAKMAATFASTGTPSFFVHPAEASHGDLGMIAKNDVIICLSNSGETTELSDLIIFANRNNIPLIAIVSNKNSTLGRSATVTLELPKNQEACPNGLAPTTSTTLMLALGDAFAVSLMTLRGFTADNFRNFHPGGKLGAKLLKVSNLMRLAKDLPLVHEQTLMSEVILEITTKALGCTGVLNTDNHLVGVITDGDLRRAMSDNFLCKTAGDIMTNNPMIINAEKSAAHAVSIMERHTITGLWIVDNVKTPIGFLHLHDCLRSGVV
jgi:arabinose-5-phosphate isomerase